jgi:anti-anti-sigma factor
VRLEGDWDAHDARPFLSATQGVLLEGARELLLDLRGVQIRDASAYLVLCELLRGFPSDRAELALAVTSPEVLRTLHECGLDVALPHFATPEGAEAWLERRRWY